MSLLIDAALAARHPRNPKTPMPVPPTTEPDGDGSDVPGCPVDSFVAARRSSKKHASAMDTVELSAALRGKKHGTKA